MDKLAVIDSLFGVSRALIGVVHLPALPGTPESRLDIPAITSIAVEEARQYEEAGFHGVMIENTHDRPYLKAGVGPEIAAAMAVIGAEVRRAVPLPLGARYWPAPTRALLRLHSPAARALSVLRASCSHT